jgi:hypothetical protein
MAVVPIILTLAAALIPPMLAIAAIERRIWPRRSWCGACLSLPSNGYPPGRGIIGMPCAIREMENLSIWTILER